MQSPVVIEVQHEHQYSDATCTERSVCRCGLTQGELLPHKDLNGDELCDDCGFNVNLKVFETPINTLDNNPNSGVLVAKEKRTWTYDAFTFVVEKGKASDIYVTKDNYMKIKKNNVLTFTGNGDVKFTEIWLTSTSTSYAKTVSNYFSTVSGATVEIVDDLVIIVRFAEPTALVSVTATGTGRIANIKIIY